MYEYKLAYRHANGEVEGFVVVKILASDLPELQMKLAFVEVQ